MILRWMTALLVACTLPLTAAGAPEGPRLTGPRLTGQLADPDFPGPGPYRVEVLETGDTLMVHPGRAFSLILPRDTVWTLCARRGEPPQALEKCFEIHYAGKDTVLSARLGGDGITVAEPEPENTDTASGANADALAALAEIPAAAAEEEAVRLQKVVVRAQRVPKRAMGRETVSAKLIKRMPGLAEADVIRSIQGLPGVVSSSDFSTKIYVRGGGSDQNLILFDNAPVFSPVHFFGLFSTFLVEGIDDVTFYKSGFPAEYGNRLSSVLDIHSREGGKDTAESWFEGSSVKISTFATQVHTEGHQGDLRWLMAGRTTYIKQVVDYLRKQGATTLNLDYYFYDLQGNLSYDLGKGRELSVSMYTGRDRLNFDPFLVNWGNTAVPVNLVWKLSDDWTSRSTASYSLMSQTFELVSIFKFYNNIETWQGKQVFEYSGIDDHRLSFGAAVEKTDVIFTNDQQVVVTKERDVPGFLLTSVFGQDKWTPDAAPGWEFTPGVRVNHISSLNEFGAEPRATVKKNLPHGQAVEAHAGRYLQYINSIIFSDDENLNEFYYPATRAKYRDVKPSSSLLLALGYSKEKLFGEYDLSIEGYYKALDHLLLAASSSEISDSVNKDTTAEFGDFFKEAQGYSLGFETSLRKPGGVISGGISYSRGYSVIREDNYDEPYYPKWHQPHSVKVDAAINWRGSDGIWPGSGQGRYFRSSTQIKYATGLPYTEYVGYESSHLIDQGSGSSAGGPMPGFEENTQLHTGNYNQSFVPSYFRWDIKPVDWGREGKWNFSWTILNITNHENVLLYEYDTGETPPKRLTIPQFPLFPFLINYEYYF
ncbi:MAG: hypothetical protein K0Q91_1574 [Fibrobacteria bacterium]|jgi:hypothetical protein|nr:hypothetical protein [Fibrobacteria bacterium]